ncbi:MAG: hypothetical protein KC464_29270, partial [Myxococcales bacterium]|nr:hypothetical protein [Myxococcales bacterium]
MYRDDLEAAIARADAAEQDLARSRDQHSDDRERIAALEQQLADARGEVTRLRGDRDDQRIQGGDRASAR